jgi:hypothetical protein
MEEEIDIAPIGEEVEGQLAHLQAMAAHEDAEQTEWTQEDEAKLQEELASIEFNPAYKTLLPEITLEHMGVRVHNPNNFIMIMGIVDGLSEGKIHPKDSFEEAYAAEAETRKYREISGRLKAEYPAIYKKILQIHQQIFVQKVHLPLNDLEKEERHYLRSQAYIAAANIARGIDPNYNVAFLDR